MAMLGGHYIFVEQEDVSYSSEVTSHPVEKGLDTTDSVRSKARIVTISGEIVENVNGLLMQNKAALLALQQHGTIVSYKGRTALSNCIIEEISISNTYDVWGACKCSITLREIKIAKTPFKDSSTGVSRSGTQQVQKQSAEQYIYHTVKKGDTIWGLTQASNAPYKSAGATPAEIMKMNPDAFSRPGDFGTLQIGKRIKIGKR